MKLQNVEKESRYGTLNIVSMIEVRIQILPMLICAVIFVSFGLISVTQVGIHLTHIAVIDRIVDNAWVVFLVGSDEQEWILPVSGLQHDGTLPQHDVEGLWGQLQITECSSESCGHPPFVADPDTTRQVHDRMIAKIAVLRARGSASFAVDHAAAADPSSR